MSGKEVKNKKPGMYVGEKFEGFPSWGRGSQGWETYKTPGRDNSKDAKNFTPLTLRKPPQTAPKLPQPFLGMPSKNSPRSQINAAPSVSNKTPSGVSVSSQFRGLASFDDAIPGFTHAVRPRKNKSNDAKYIASRNKPTRDSDFNPKAIAPEKPTYYPPKPPKPKKRGFTNADIVKSANYLVGGKANLATGGASINDVAKAAINRKKRDLDAPSLPTARYHTKDARGKGHGDEYYLGPGQKSYGTPGKELVKTPKGWKTEK